MRQREYTKTHKKQISENKKIYHQIHKEEIKEKKKEYYETHKKEILLKDKTYKEKNKEKITNRKRIYQANKKETDINYKLQCILRDRLNKALNGNYKSGSAVADLMMSISDFKIYLEQKFYPNPDTGEIMTWENYGKLGWHIDHIIPLCLFNLINREEFLRACHYSNLRPMWARQNRSEGGKLNRIIKSPPKPLQKQVT